MISLLYTVIVLVTAIIFYYIGRLSTTTQDIEVIARHITKHKKVDAGAIKPLSPEERKKRGTTIEQVENEMTKVFENIL